MDSVAWNQSCAFKSPSAAPVGNMLSQLLIMAALSLCAVLSTSSSSFSTGRKTPGELLREIRMQSDILLKQDLPIPAQVDRFTALVTRFYKRLENSLDGLSPQECLLCLSPAYYPKVIDQLKEKKNLREVFKLYHAAFAQNPNFLRLIMPHYGDDCAVREVREGSTHASELGSLINYGDLVHRENYYRQFTNDEYGRLVDRWIANKPFVSDFVYFYISQFSASPKVTFKFTIFESPKMAMKFALKVKELLETREVMIFECIIDLLRSAPSSFMHEKEYRALLSLYPGNPMDLHRFFLTDEGYAWKENIFYSLTNEDDFYKLMAACGISRDHFHGNNVIGFSLLRVAQQLKKVQQI